MVSLITANTHMPKSTQTFSHLSFPHICSVFMGRSPRRRLQDYRKAAVFGPYGVLGVKNERYLGGGKTGSWCCWCKGGEADADLEAEILKFMEKSKKPTMFPTKKELVEGGRMDLVEAIKKKGGWFSFGWEDEDLENLEDVDSDIEEFQKRLESFNESVSLEESDVDSFSEIDEAGHGNLSSEKQSSPTNVNSCQQALSSGSSLEIGAEKHSGIEGILSGLEKQRNKDLGIDLGKDGNITSSSKAENGSMQCGNSADVDRVDPGNNRRLTSSFPWKDALNSSGGKVSSNLEQETWRTWSMQRAGIQAIQFEAAEIPFSEKSAERSERTSADEITTVVDSEAWDSPKEINHQQIRTRLQHLEFELTAALSSLRSKKEEHIPEVAGSSYSDLQKLSDAWEFQENEFLDAQQRLRSLRAKLAIIEGKMALAINDVQKMVEEKQRRIDGAYSALQLLRTACIVWPNPASEVFLAGSFDGWTTQRRMEKSKTGVFSVYLKLYPGRYEIKFIVDGTWKVDPLRPIIHNNGYENNLLIIHENTT